MSSGAEAVNRADPKVGHRAAVSARENADVGTAYGNDPCHSCRPDRVEPLCDCDGRGCCLSAHLCSDHNCRPCPTEGLCNGGS